MIKFLIKVYCFLKGHDWLETGTVDNGHSCFGEYNCMRCNKVQSWNYDYQ